MLEATLLEEVPQDQLICTQEAFGRVAVLSQFSEFDDSLEQVNNSTFGCRQASLHVISIRYSVLGMSWMWEVLLLVTYPPGVLIICRMVALKIAGLAAKAFALRWKT